MGIPRIGPFRTAQGNDRAPSLFRGDFKTCLALQGEAGPKGFQLI